MSAGRGWVWAANLSTVLNGVCGAGAVAYTLLGNKTFALCLIFAGVAFDGLDGHLYRRSGRPPSLFGRVADSVADGITFGLAPGCAIAFDNTPSTVWDPWARVALVLGGAVVALAWARLVHFTAVAYQHPSFTGASTPQNAMWVVLVILLFGTSGQYYGFLVNSPVVELSLIAIGAPIMVLPVRYPKVRQSPTTRLLASTLSIFLAVTLLLVAFEPPVGGTFFHLGYSAAVTSFLLLVLFYLTGPLVARRLSKEDAGDEGPEGEGTSKRAPTVRVRRTTRPAPEDERPPDPPSL